MAKYKQSTYTQIADLFLKPLIKMRPRKHDPAAWLRGLFDVDSRVITRFRAVEKFELPGAYYRTPTRTELGTGPRKVKKGDELFVRTDAREPDVIEVEIVNAREDKAYPKTPVRWFKLNRTDWRNVRPKVEKC